MTADSANSQRLGIAIILIAAIGFIVGSSLVIYDGLYIGGTDIYPTWQGGRFFWQDGLTPYDDKVGEASQAVIYEDGVADEGEDAFQFVYPFYLILYMGPLPLLEFRLAVTIFMQSVLIIFGVTLALSMDTLRWLPKPFTLGIAVLVFLTSYFSARGLLLAQPAILAYGFHIGAYWAIARGYNREAGILLALSTIKPQTGYLIVPLLLIWAWFNGRRALAYGFGTTFVGLFVISLIFLPTWFFEWMGRVFDYRDYTETLATVQIITHAIDAMPDVVQVILQLLVSIAVLIPVMLFWNRAILKQDNSNFYWGIMLTMCASLLVAPRTATTYYIELYPALLVAMMLLEQRKSGLLWITLGSIGAVVGYWALHIVTAPPVEDAGEEAAIVYVVFPTVVYAWLLLSRTTWQSIDILNRPTTQG